MAEEQFVEQFRQEITGKELHFSTPRGTDPKKEYTVTAAAAMEGRRYLLYIRRQRPQSVCQRPLYGTAFCGTCDRTGLCGL